MLKRNYYVSYKWTGSGRTQILIHDPFKSEAAAKRFAHARIMEANGALSCVVVHIHDANGLTPILCQGAVDVTGIFYQQGAPIVVTPWQRIA